MHAVAVLNVCADTNTTLQVLDSVWSKSLLDQLLISNMRGVVLITARSRILESPEVLTFTMSAAVEQRQAAEQLIRPGRCRCLRK